MIVLRELGLPDTLLREVELDCPLCGEPHTRAIVAQARRLRLDRWCAMELWRVGDAPARDDAYLVREYLAGGDVECVESMVAAFGVPWMRLDEAVVAGQVWAGSCAPEEVLAELCVETPEELLELRRLTGRGLDGMVLALCALGCYRVRALEGVAHVEREGA